MNTRSAFGGIGISVLMGCVASLAAPRAAIAQSASVAQTASDAFRKAVDLSPLSAIAVQSEGRFRSFDSHAKALLKVVTGPKTINGQSPGFTYLDLMLRPEAYADVDLIYVKNRLVRRSIVQRLQDAGAAVSPERLAKFEESGLIAKGLLELPAIAALRDELSRDAIKTEKDMNALNSALVVAGADLLADRLQIVPPRGRGATSSWAPAAWLWGAADPKGAVKAGLRAERLGDLTQFVDASKVDALTTTWNTLVTAWRGEDANGVNTAVAALASLLPNLEPGAYPDTKRMSWESWYFRMHGLTWGWAFYLIAIIFVLLSIVYRFPFARKLGMGLFIFAVLFHTSAIGLRFYVSQRWPNSNMFEAVTTAAWFGSILALAIEFVARKTILRGWFALAGSVAAMCGLMAGHFVPELDSSIGNKMAALNDIWIYIHTNVIISSYCLIAMAAVSALIYLGYRLVGGSKEVSRAGGAGTLVMNSAPGSSFLLDDKKTTLGVVLDAVTMVLMELSFVMLWTGLVMGAIWADHSWGRPWGWDPKENFALNTFIIFLLLVHVRIKVKDKGLWTAGLAVAGCGVMLFNWIVINFIVSGLHSYA